ncbi:hypothetical protein FRB90_010239 [Tulasnella sp. 427]|nr:hypothetical protein FRB90_010239 [Tulasnella sp. 427]
MSTITTAFVFNAPNAAYDFPLSAPYNFDTYNAGMFEGYLPTSEYADTRMGYCPQQMGVWVKRRAAAMIEDSFRTNWRVESRKSAPDLKVAPLAVAAGVLPVATRAKVKPTTTTKIPATSVAQSIAQQDKAMQQLFAIAKRRYEQLAKCSGPIPAHVTRVFRPLSETPSKLNTECRNPRVATQRRGILKPDPTALQAMGSPAPSPKSPRKVRFLFPEA